MAYNRNNLLRKYQKILDITTTHYDPVYFKYKSIWRNYIKNQFDIGYEHYMHIISSPKIMQEVSELKKREDQNCPNPPELF